MPEFLVYSHPRYPDTPVIRQQDFGDTGGPDFRGSTVANETEFEYPLAKTFWVPIGVSYDSRNLTGACARREVNTGTGIDAIVLAVCLRQRSFAGQGRDKIDPFITEYHGFLQLFANILRATARTSYNVGNLKEVSPLSKNLFCSDGMRANNQKNHEPLTRKKLKTKSNFQESLLSGLGREVGDSESRQDLEMIFSQHQSFEVGS